jgi:hypothetical protein
MRLLQRIQAPDEEAAAERTWSVVRAAYREREPVLRSRRRARPALLLAAALAVVAGAATSPGRAVIGSLRKAVGVEHAAPELFRLPMAGRLLVNSSAGPWIVKADGSKRHLGGWRDAAWSPHGLYVVASRANELAALDPQGHVRWTLSRPAVRLPSWGGSTADTRIAYLTTSRLHVVAGDGTQDGDAGGMPAAARVAPAWRPGAGLLLAYVTTRGRVKSFDAAGTSAWQSSVLFPHPRSLEWSSDGQRLLVVTRDKVAVLRGGRPLSLRSERVEAATFRPGTHDVTVIRRRGPTSEALVGGRVVFRGTGSFEDLAWSPDGRWLLLTWPTADQWVFVRVTGPRKIVAVSNVTRQFGGGSFPTLAGWCCSAP